MPGLGRPGVSGCVALGVTRRAAGRVEPEEPLGFSGPTYLGTGGTNLADAKITSKNSFRLVCHSFVQLTKALLNNYYGKYCIYMSETKV